MSQAPAFSVQSILSPYIWTFCLSFGVSFLLTPAMGPVAFALGITDAPDGKRKLHGRTMPYLGGIAMFAAWAASLAIHYIAHRSLGAGVSIASTAFAGLVGGAAVIAAVGLWDDTWNVKPRTKIAGQIAASIFLFGSGISSHSAEAGLIWLVRMIAAACGCADPFVHQIPGWFAPLAQIASFVFTMAVVVGCCNSMNLMDGLDGLCAGVTAIIIAGFLLLAVHLAASAIDPKHYELRIILALTALGAVLGFVPFNFNPATIFMGDTGSMFLGYCCAASMLLMAEASLKWFLAAMVIFALPALDTALAFVRRRMAGRSVFAADTQHIHHQLVQKGLTVRQTALACYAISATFMLLGSAMAFLQARCAIAIYLVAFCFIAVAAAKMGMISEQPIPGHSGKRLSRTSLLSPVEVRALFEAAPDSQFKTLLQFVWETGCRGSDAARIRVRHLDADAQCIRLPVSKDPFSHEKVISLNDAATRLVESLTLENPNAYLFSDPAGIRWTKASISAQFHLLDRKLGGRHSLALLRRSRFAALAAKGSRIVGVDVSFDRPEQSGAWEAAETADQDMLALDKSDR